MSYILDALKRAERERRQGQAPTAFDDMTSAAVPEPAPSPLRRYLPFIALFVIAAAVGAGTVLLMRGPTPAPAAASLPAATPAPSIAPTPASSDAALRHPVEDAAGEADAKIGDDAHIASLDDLTGDSDKPEAAGAAVAAARPTAPTAELARAPAAPKPATGRAPLPATTEPQARPPAGDAATPARAASEAPIAATTTAPAAGMGEVAATPTEAAGNEPPPPGAVMPKPRRQTPRNAGPGLATPGIEAIKPLKDMPQAYRAEFPPVTIDVLAYTDDPARSFVILGGKRYKAGDNLAEGPHIADIVPEGIIFDWRGERVLMATPH